ncbi:MAG: hypothetical protein ACPGSC_03460 [Granulosicoccaceae bacterium]
MELNTTTLAFCGVMGLLFLIDFLTSFSRANHRDFRSIIVTIGVLGTFVGVYMGLQGFDTGDIRTSVPQLLDGMKTAFFTSIVGMALSVVLSILQRLRGGADEDADLLVQANQKLEVLSELVEETKALRQNQAETNATLSTAMSQLSEGATQQIVDSLQQVVTEFNTNLSDQFGENFRELNQGVANLLEWQENYRLILERDQEVMSNVHGSLESSAQTLATVAQTNEQTREVYEGLGQMINTYHGQIETLREQTAQYAGLSDKAALAFSQLDAGFESMQHGLQVQSESVARLTRELERQLPQSLGHLESTLTGLTNRFAKDYQSFLNRYRELVES